MHKFLVNTTNRGEKVSNDNIDYFKAARLQFDENNRITKWDNATKNNGGDVIPRLYCRPTVEPNKKTWAFQVIDIQSYKTDVYVDPFIMLFGTTEEGNSICVRIRGFEPYVDIQVPIQADDEFMTCLCDDIKGNVHGIYKTMQRIFGYVPDKNGNPKRFKWARLFFEKDTNRKMFIRNMQRSAHHLRSRLIRKVKHMQDELRSFTFNIASEKMNMINLFTTAVGVIPSGWVQVSGDNLNGNEHPFAMVMSTCQIEMELDMVTPLPERTDIAPIVTLSFDLECIGPRDSFPQSYNPNDMVVQAGVSFHVAGRGIVHRAVICLGETANVLDGEHDIHIITCTSEVELMNQFRNIIHHSRIDCDILTG